MASMNELADMLTTKEVAAYLRVSLQQAQRMLRAGEIRSIRVGREYRIPKRFLAEFVGISQ